MTTEQLNIAISKKRGFLVVKSLNAESYHLVHPDNRVRADWFSTEAEAWREAPDHVNGPTALNEMHEAEKLLTGDEWRIFLGFLSKTRTIPKLMSMDEFHACWLSDAPERALAYVKTIGQYQR